MSSLGITVYLPDQTLLREIGSTINNYAGIIGINWNRPEQTTSYWTWILNQGTLYVILFYTYPHNSLTGINSSNWAFV